jgi:hypothetical protein
MLRVRHGRSGPCLEAQGLLKVLSRRRQPLEERLDVLRARLDENRSCLDAMRQKAEPLAGEDASDLSETAWVSPDLVVRDEDAELAFLREKQARGRS